MAFNIGSAIAYIKADISDFKKGIETAKGQLGNFKDGIGQINDSLSGFRNTAHIAAAGAVAAFSLFGKSAVDAKSELDKAIISLDIIAERFGQSGKEAGKLAVSLGKELRIGTGAAAEGLQNLIKSGLNLDQASDLLRRFTNEAMTGKSSSIDLGTAVQNLSFAFATGNSALGNMSGISENWSDITDKGANILGKWNGKANEKIGITKQLADQIKAYEASLKKQGKTLDANDAEQAKYIGLLQLTNLTMGSSERFQGTYTDNVAKMGLKVTELKVALGTLLQNALNPIVQWFTNSGVIDYFTRMIGVIENIGWAIAELANGENVMAELTEGLTFFTNDNWDMARTIAEYIRGFIGTMQQLGAWIQANREQVITFITSFGMALGGILIIAEIIALINLLLNPITWVIAAVTAFFYAYQTNFWGIRDITNSVITELLNFYNNILAPAVKWLTQYLTDRWQFYATMLSGIWDVIQGVVKVGWAFIYGILATGIALLTGDWKKAWEAIQKMWELGLEGLKQIGDGILKFIIGWGAGVLAELVRPFGDAWKKIEDTMKKIRDAIDFTKRHSPSVIDLINRGVHLANRAWENLEMPELPNVTQSISQGIRSVSVQIDMGQAIIANEASALDIGELIGDSIIKKLQNTVRI